MSPTGSRTLWEEGHEPGREMVALGVALALTAACLDLLLTGRIGILFDLLFVVLCVGLALAVHPRDLFTVGVLPPLLMLATFGLLAASRSEAIAGRDDGLATAVVGGLSHHVGALAVGYLLCLGVLGVRRRYDAVQPAAAPQEPAAAPLTRSGPGPRLHA